MSVKCSSRSWAKQQGPLLLGFLITSGACARKDQDTRASVGASGAEGRSVVVAPAALASSTLEGPPRPDEAPRLSPLIDGAVSDISDAGSAPKSRTFALGAKGRVYVSTLEDGKVYAFVDDDDDHKVDRVYVVGAGLDGPATPVFVTGEPPVRKHQGWRYVRFGVDDWLYIPIGTTYAV